MKLRCCYCKIMFDVPDFAAVELVQSWSCENGGNHRLSEVVRDG